MAEFVSSFITGFQDVVSSDLPARLKGSRTIAAFSKIDIFCNAAFIGTFICAP